MGLLWKPSTPTTGSSEPLLKQNFSSEVGSSLGREDDDDDDDDTYSMTDEHQEQLPDDWESYDDYLSLDTIQTDDDLIHWEDSFDDDNYYEEIEEEDGNVLMIQWRSAADDSGVSVWRHGENDHDDEEDDDYGPY